MPPPSGWGLGAESAPPRGSFGVTPTLKTFCHPQPVPLYSALCSQPLPPPPTDGDASKEPKVGGAGGLAGCDDGNDGGGDGGGKDAN